MSVQKLKSTILQLERKRNKRRLAVRRLQEDHDQLLLHCKAMDLLVQHQDIVVRMLHRYFQPCCSPPSSIEDDTGFITPLLHDCPQLADFKAMRLADYNWLLSATAQQVGARCFHHLQRIATVMNQRKASSSSSSSSSSSTSSSGDGGGSGGVSQQQQADMDAAVSELLLLTKAMYILTPGIVYALRDVNLMTGQLDPPPDSHWERAFCATEASLEQLELFEEVLRLVVPKMQQLEEDRQELAACINSVKALTLKEQFAHAVAAAQQLVQQQQEEEQRRQQAQRQQQQQKQQKQQTKGRVGASRAAGLRKEAVQQVAAVTAAAVAAASAAARVKKEDPAYAQANGWHYSCAAAQVAVKKEIKQEIKQEPAGSNGYYTSLLQQAVEAAGPAAPPQAAAAAVPAAAAAAANGVSDGSDSNSNSSSNSATSSSASTLRYMRGTCKDMLAHMESRLLKWRTLSGARSAVTFILRFEQIAAMLLAAFPYLPMMGCMCDYVPAARAAAEQRETPQQQPKQQKQKQQRRQQR